MATNFLEQRKRQKYLIPIILVVIIATAIILWFGYFRKEQSPFSPKTPISPTLREIEIDFSVLENPFLTKLQPFIKISPFEGKKGRINPFEPY